MHLELLVGTTAIIPSVRFINHSYKTLVLRHQPLTLLTLLRQLVTALADCRCSLGPRERSGQCHTPVGSGRATAVFAMYRRCYFSSYVVFRLRVSLDYIHCLLLCLLVERARQQTTRTKTTRYV